MRLRDTTHRKERMINMKIAEQLFLTEHERYILTKAYNLIDDIYVDTSDTDVENTAHDLTKILDSLLEIAITEEKKGVVIQ